MGSIHIIYKLWRNSTILEYPTIQSNSIYIENRLLKFENILFKNLSDKILAYLRVPILIPIHILISILIKLDSKGSIIF